MISGTFQFRCPGWSREAHRKMRPRGMVVPLFSRADRTRLTGCLAIFPLLFGHDPTVAVLWFEIFPQGCPQERNTNIVMIQNWRRVKRPVLGKCLTKPGNFPSNHSVKGANPLTSQFCPCYPMPAHDGPSSTRAPDSIRPTTPTAASSRHGICALDTRVKYIQQERQTGPHGPFYRHSPEQARR